MVLRQAKGISDECASQRWTRLADGGNRDNAFHNEAEHIGKGPFLKQYKLTRLSNGHGKPTDSLPKMINHGKGGQVAVASGEVAGACQTN
jgi:hypothetical protein